MENDLHARVQTLARLRRGRIGVSDRWDSSGGTDRHNYLTSYTAPAALLIPANSARSSPTVAPAPKMAMRPRAAEQRDELATFQMIEQHSIPLRAEGGLQDIELAGISQEVTERFCLACCSISTLVPRIYLTTLYFLNLRSLA